MNIPSVLRRYNRHTFFGDLTAGLVVAVVALPLCIAFAIASGVSPEKGIATAVIAGLAVALFSGSKVQIAGPSGPFVVIAFGIISQYGPQDGLNALFIATFIAGVMLVIMGVAGLGMLMKFIPYPVIGGFTTGVAILLISTELNDFFGLTVAQSGHSVVERFLIFGGAIHTTNWWAVAVALGTVLLQALQPKLWRRVPASLVALIVATAAVQIFMLPVDTIGSHFKIPSGFPVPGIPHITFEAVRRMVEPALAIAILAAIEALLAAVVADGMTGGTHEPNRVLIAQGIANIGTAVFGCLPATAAIARTATNVRNGAQTRAGGVIHSLLLLLIVLFFGRWASLIPLSCLAGILAYVAYHMFDWRSFVALLKNPKSDVAVLLTTLGLTVFVDLTTGLLVGMVMAAALFVRGMASATHVAVVTREFAIEKEHGVTQSSPQTIPRDVEVFEIHGPLFFGAVYKLRESLSLMAGRPKVRMIRMARVNQMDSTGLHALEDIHRLCRKQGAAFLISEIHAQPFTALLKSGLLQTFGEENVLASFEEALRRAHEILAEKADHKT